MALGHRGLATKEVDLHLADEPAAELGVADSRPLARRRRVGTRDLRGDVVGDDSRGRLSENPGLGDVPWAGADVAEGVHVPECGPKVGLVDRHPAVDRQAETASGSGARCTGIPTNRS